MNRNCVTGVFLSLVVSAAGAAYGQTASSEIDFSATREGEFIVAEARVDLAAAPALAWAVLTDYEAYPRFISTMRVSKVVSRDRTGTVVDQKGSFGFLFFSQEIEARMLVAEFPPSSIVARSVGGSFRELLGRYELLPVGGGVRLSYTGRLVPEFSLPPLIGMSIVHYALKKNFTEMVDEIRRRDALARQAFKAAQ
ncbi:MAG: SRPBCC family protein [Burkholderiales bacterium]|nr:SRPBCC family protein [Burkholderiales bacterium]